MLLSWHKYGGGKELLTKLYASIGANVVSFPYGPMPTQPLGWFKKPITKLDGLQGPQVPHRGHLDRRVHRHGRGGQRAARRRDRAGDGPRPARCGRVQQRELGPPARLRRRLQGVHAAELPPERRAVRDHVQQDQVRRAAGEDEGDHRERASRRPRRTCRGRRSTATRRTTSSCRPRTRSTSTRRRTAILQAQLDAYDAAAAKKRADNALFKEIEESQKAFAERAVRWDLDTNVSRRMAYNHYFGARPPAAQEEGVDRMAGNDQPSGASRVAVLFSASGVDRLTDLDWPHAENAAVRRQDQHLGRPGLFLAASSALTLHDLLGGVLALRARQSARLGVRRHDHDVRHAVHDGGRLHAGEERPRARRRALRLLPAAHAGDARPDALHRVLPSRASSR